MSTHALALATLILFVAYNAMVIATPSEKAIDWGNVPPQRWIRALTGIPLDVFVVWLIVRTLS